MSDGCFNCDTSRFMALGWLEKKKKERILNFDHFRLATLEQFLDTLGAIVHRGQMFPGSITVNAYTSRQVIGVAILFSGHPYMIRKLVCEQFFTSCSQNIAILGCFSINIFPVCEWKLIIQDSVYAELERHGLELKQYAVADPGGGSQGASEPPFSRYCMCII